MTRSRLAFLAVVILLAAATTVWSTPFPGRSPLGYPGEPEPVAQGSHWTINHISAALHVANVHYHNALAVRCVNTTGTAYESCAGSGGPGGSGDAINVFHQSTIRHISSTTHIIGQVFLTGVSGMAISNTGTALDVSVRSTGTTFDVNCLSGCSGSSVVNVGHISSVTHVVGRTYLTNLAGTAVTVTGTALDVNCTGCAAASVVNVGHISSAVHVVGTVACTNCTGGPTDAVNVFHQSTVRHVSSLTHVVIVDWQRWAHVAAAQSGAWSVVAHQGGTWNIGHISSALHIAGVVSVNCSNCSGGSGDAVNVFHQSTIRHVSSLTHVVIVDWQRWAHVASAQSGVWNVVAHQGGTWSVSATQSGAWNVSAAQSGSFTVQAAHQGGEWNIRHIGSVLHVAGYGTFLVNLHGSASMSVAQSGAWSVTAHQGGTWNIGHISSALHIAGVVSVNCANCTGGSGDAVNVFHQSTIRHISSVVHVAGYGTFLVNLHGGASASVAQSGTWNVVVHQGGTAWNVAHITSVTHIMGGVFLRSQAGTIVTVTGTALDVNCTGCAAASVVNVGHISSRVHVTGHVFLTNYVGQPLRTMHGGSLAMTMQTSAGAEIDWTTATSHISSQVHLAVALKAGSNHQMVEITGPHLTGAVHVSGISNIGSGNAGTGTTAITCHSTLALHITGTGFATAGGSAFGGSRSIAVLHLTSSNGGVNQSTWRFYICSVSIWSNVGMGNTVNITGGPTGANVGRHMASSFSIIEGSGTDCATSPRPLIGSLGTEGVPLVNYHAGATMNMISPFPFMSTQVGGNSLCIIHGMKGSQYITGSISYRASP